MSESDEIAELEPLIWALLDGSLTAEQRARLDLLLGSSTQARLDYLDRLEVHAMLRKQLGEAEWTGGLPHGTDDEFSSTPEIIKQSWFDVAKYVTVNYVPVSLAVATFCMAATLLLLALFVPPWRQSLLGGGAEQLEFVAKVTATQGAVWHELSHGNFQKKMLATGERLMLSGGAAEVTFADGARVLLEGPSTLTIDSGGSASLEIGRLAAWVPPAAVGFEISTPLMRISDLGTEFCVEVDSEGEAKIAVLTGLVELIPHRKEDRPANPMRISAGQSMRVTTTGLVENLPAKQADRLFELARRGIRLESRGSNAPLISGLPLSYQVISFYKGARRLSDETYQIVAAPQVLLGLPGIVPPRGQGLRHPGAGYRFHLREPRRLYLAVHDRGDPVLEGWERTNESVTWTIEGQTHTDTLYTRVFPPGEVEIPTHVWHDSQSRYGVPHLCLVAKLPVPAGDLPAETRNAPKEPAERATP